VQFSCSVTITLTSTINLITGVTISAPGTIGFMIFPSSSSVTLKDLTISNSGTTGTTGGGIQNDGTLNVINSTFSDNQASDGGGLINFGIATVTNSTFTRNTALSSGGATLTVSNSTFSGNSAGSGGGIAAFVAPISVINSTFSGNSDPNGSIYSTGSVTDKGGNLADDATCAFTQSSSKNNATALNLGALANNGGPTQTIALLAGSQAIGAGVSSICNAPQSTARISADSRAAARAVIVAPTTPTHPCHQRLPLLTHRRLRPLIP
jgi:hypothetical protein